MAIVHVAIFFLHQLIGLRFSRLSTRTTRHLARISLASLPAPTVIIATCRTPNSWSRPRRVVGKAKYMDKGENPRFVVTNLSAQEYEGQELYEKLYCARKEMENRIKGATAIPVCRQDQFRHYEGQPAAPMVFLVGLCDSQRPSLCRASGNANGRSDLCEHAAEAVQNRGTREGERAARGLQHGQRLSRSGSVPLGSLESTANLPPEMLSKSVRLGKRIIPGDSAALPPFAYSGNRSRNPMIRVFPRKSLCESAVTAFHATNHGHDCQRVTLIQLQRPQCEKCGLSFRLWLQVRLHISWLSVLFGRVCYRSSFQRDCSYED